jgi:hypothetical protein
MKQNARVIKTSEISLYLLSSFIFPRKCTFQNQRTSNAKEFALINLSSMMIVMIKGKLKSSASKEKRKRIKQTSVFFPKN